MPADNEMIHQITIETMQEIVNTSTDNKVSPDDVFVQLMLQMLANIMYNRSMGPMETATFLAHMLSATISALADPDSAVFVADGKIVSASGVTALDELLKRGK